MCETIIFRFYSSSSTTTTTTTAFFHLNPRNHNYFSFGWRCGGSTTNHHLQMHSWLHQMLHLCAEPNQTKQQAGLNNSHDNWPGYIVHRLFGHHWKAINKLLIYGKSSPVLWASHIINLHEEKY